MSTARTQTILALENLATQAGELAWLSILLNEKIAECRLPIPRVDASPFVEVKHAAEHMLCNLEIKANA